MAKFRPLHWLGEGVHHVFHGTTIAHLDLRNRILTAFTLTIIVDLILTFVVFKLEAGQKGSNINSMWDSFYYTTSQLTTLGSPMNNPVTVPGQAVVLLSIFMQRQLHPQLRGFSVLFSTMLLINGTKQARRNRPRRVHKTLKNYTK